MATKLRALYQRKKGRDLFDLHLGMCELKMNCENVVNLFIKYNEETEINISRAQLERNIHQKISDPLYLQDINPLLHGDISWDPMRTYNRLLNEVIPLLPGKAWKG